MTPWKSDKHFTSWLSLCPGTKVSGGKKLHRRNKRNANRGLKHSAWRRHPWPEAKPHWEHSTDGFDPEQTADEL